MDFMGSIVDFGVIDPEISTLLTPSNNPGENIVNQTNVVILLFD
jgi:hypothetical protein